MRQQQSITTYRNRNYFVSTIQLHTQTQTNCLQITIQKYNTKTHQNSQTKTSQFSKTINKISTIIQYLYQKSDYIMLKSFDYFRRVQGDQELSSSTGGIFTLIAIILACTLSYYSFRDYYKDQYLTHLEVRKDASPFLPMNINILFNKMPCNALTIQFFDELQYTQDNLEEKLTLEHIDPSQQNITIYKRSEDIEHERMQLQKKIEMNYGCRITGFLPLPKTPGTLVFKPTAINNIFLTLPTQILKHTKMSYRIDTLDFGINNSTFEVPLSHKSKNIANYLKQLEGLSQKQKYIQNFHQQHRQLDYLNHLKIIPLCIEDIETEQSISSKPVQKYRYSLRSGVTEIFDNEPIAAVMFMIEIEPIHIIYRKHSPKIINLVIEMMAIAGGAMAAIGLLNAASHLLFGMKQ